MTPESITHKRDHYVHIQDDDPAKAFLFSLGLLDKFGEVPRPVGLSGGWVTAVGYSDHVTHWIVGVLYSGYDSDSDNGYAVMCFPKCAMSSKQVMDKVRSELCCEFGLEGEKNVPIRTNEN